MISSWVLFQNLCSVRTLHYISYRDEPLLIMSSYYLVVAFHSSYTLRLCSLRPPNVLRVLYITQRLTLRVLRLYAIQRFMKDKKLMKISKLE